MALIMTFLEKVTDKYSQYLLMKRSENYIFSINLLGNQAKIKNKAIKHTKDYKIINF